MQRTVAIYALTRAGAHLARRLAGELGGASHVIARHAEPGDRAFDSLADLVPETFARFDAHVFVAAAGVVVRIIAGLLRRKDLDPAVVVLDQEGRFAVSLVSGHLGGANDLARRCAEITGGQAVITTATDTAGLPSVDVLARVRGLRLANVHAVRLVNAALLDGVAVQVHDPEGCLAAPQGGLYHEVSAGEWREGAPGVWVSWKNDCPDESALRLCPPLLCLGIGCRKGVESRDILDAVRQTLERFDLAECALARAGSVELKQGEPGLVEAALQLGVELTFFDADRLEGAGAPNPSDKVRRVTGTGSVAEAAALLLARGGPLVAAKQKIGPVTVAVARMEEISC